MYPLVRELAAKDAPMRVPVAVTCRVLKIARQPYYRWLAEPVTDRDWVQAHLVDAIVDAHADDPEFGYRLIADAVRDNGWEVSDRTVWKHSSRNGVWSVFGKKRGKNGKKAGPPVFDDRVQRDFTATAANRLWLTDITEHRTRQGKLYICAVKDVFSNRIVGYSMSDRMKSQLAVRAVENAVAMRGDVAGCIVHSDRGSQGGFNWSSQHLDHGGVARWRRSTGLRRRARFLKGLDASGARIARCGRRCARLGGLSRLGRCSGSSGV